MNKELEELGGKKISTFWNAVVASIIMTATAIILSDSDHVGKIVVFEGILFGVRSGNDLLKDFIVQQRSKNNE